MKSRKFFFTFLTFLTFLLFGLFFMFFFRIAQAQAQVLTVDPLLAVGDLNGIKSVAGGAVAIEELNPVGLEGLNAGMVERQNLLDEIHRSELGSKQLLGSAILPVSLKDTSLLSLGEIGKKVLVSKGWELLIVHSLDLTDNKLIGADLLGTKLPKSSVLLDHNLSIV